MKNLISIFLILGLSAGVSAAEKLYVKDSLDLDLRSGPSNEYRIIKFISSGEHLIVVEDEELTDNRYTKVRTGKGDEGYVLSRFLQSEPIAKEKLIFANREIEKLKGDLAKVRTERDEYKSNTNKLQSQSSNLSSSKDELEKELAHIKSISASALELDKKYKALVQENQELEVQLQSISTENAQLHDTRQQTYILYGGGLVFAGILAGLILPALRGKRNSGWS